MDIVGLYPSIRVKKALAIVRRKLEEDGALKSKTECNLVYCCPIWYKLHHCLNTIVFFKILYENPGKKYCSNL